MFKRSNRGDNSVALQELCVNLAGRQNFNFAEESDLFSTEELSAIHPLSLYHAAALSGRAAAVLLLAARGVPISLADRAVFVDRNVSRLLSSPDVHVGMLVRGSTALSLAAQLGHCTVVRELLAAGADPSAGSFPPLMGAVRFSAGSASAATAVGDLMGQLLTAGADVTAPAVLHGPLALTKAGCTQLAHMLLSNVYAHSRAGLLAAPMAAVEARVQAAGLQALLAAAVLLDDVVPFCHFAAVLVQLVQRWPEALRSTTLHRLAAKLLSTAVLSGSETNGVLRMAQRAAAAAGSAVSVANAPPALAAADAAVQRVFAYVRPCEVAAVRQLMLADSRDCLAELLRLAARNGRTTQLQLLLAGGQPPTLAAVVAAAQAQSLQALHLLLAAGRPPVPADVAAIRPYNDHSNREYDGVHPMLVFSTYSWSYSCPLLACLKQRMYRVRDKGEECMHARTPGDADHPTPIDLEWLPLVEALVGAGYRPAVYHDVEVKTGFQVVRRFERFDPAQEDCGLEANGRNTWLWLAAQRLNWSPANHAHFLPSFKAAARTVLLAAHRLAGTSGACGGSGTGSTQGGKRRINSPHAQQLNAPAAASFFLGSLPRELLPRIVGLAAYPLSAWAPLDVA